MDLLASLAAEKRWLFPTFLATYAAIYCFGQLVLFRRRWAPWQRQEGASCLISLVHGTPAALAALGAIRRTRRLAPPAPPRSSFAAPNARLQDHLLDHSVAYFAVDLLHRLAFLLPSPAAAAAGDDVLVVGHHLGALFVLLTCRYRVRHGAHALLVLLLLAEATSPLHNAWTLAGMWRDRYPAAARVYGAVSPPFYALYALARGVAAPLFLLRMAAFYLSGRQAAADVIPWWARISWILVVGAGIAVSIWWIWNLI